MTVESSDWAEEVKVDYKALEKESSHPSSLMASIGLNGELKNVTFKSLVATQYVQLNETLLEGLVHSHDEDKNTSPALSTDELRRQMRLLRDDCLSAKEDIKNCHKKYELMPDSKELFHKVDTAFNETPQGQKIIPKIESTSRIYSKRFKSAKVDYRKVTIEKAKALARHLKEEAERVKGDKEDEATKREDTRGEEDNAKNETSVTEDVEPIAQVAKGVAIVEESLITPQGESDTVHVASTETASASLSIAPIADTKSVNNISTAKIGADIPPTCSTELSATSDAATILPTAESKTESDSKKIEASEEASSLDVEASFSKDTGESGNSSLKNDSSVSESREHAI